MAKHETLIGQSITAASLWVRMESRFSYLYDHDKYNGQYAGEFDFIESVLADSFTEEEVSRDGGMPNLLWNSGRILENVTGKHIYPFESAAVLHPIIPLDPQMRNERR